MSNDNNNLIRMMAYFSLVILAVMVFITKLLPLVGINIQGGFFSLLSTIENVMTMLVLAVVGYEFVSGKKKIWKIIYWISLAVFLVGIILIWL